MHRIQCKFIKIEGKLHHRRTVAHTFLLFSLCAVRSSVGCFRSWRSCSFFVSASFARFCSSAPLFSLSALFHPSFLALPSRWPCLGRSCPQSSSSSPPHRRPLPRGVGPLCPFHGTGPSSFPSPGGLAFPYAGNGSLPRPPWWASWGRPRWLPTLGGLERVCWFGVGLGCFAVRLEVAELGGKAFLGHEVVEEIVGVVERFGVVGGGQLVGVSLEAG